MHLQRNKNHWSNLITDLIKLLECNKIYNVFFFKLKESLWRAVNTAQETKVLAHKHENVSLNPQKPWEKKKLRVEGEWGGPMEGFKGKREKEEMV